MEIAGQDAELPEIRLRTKVPFETFQNDNFLALDFKRQ